MARFLIKLVQVTLLMTSLVIATGSWAADEETTASESGTERPGYGAAIADTVLIRPLTLVATVVGTVIFVVTSPITAVTGTIGEAGETLVVDPAMTTFYRCLGCTEVGWRKLPHKDASDE